MREEGTHRESEEGREIEAWRGTEVIESGVEREGGSERGERGGRGR